MNQDLLVFQSYVYGLCLIQSIGIGDLDLDKVMVFAVGLSKPSKDALGAVGTLATITVELVLASLMLRAHPIVTATLGHIHPLMQTHDFSYLVVHEGIPRLAPAHHLHVLGLMNGKVALVTEEGGVVLAELGRLGRTRDTIVDLFLLFNGLFDFVTSL